MEDHTGNVVPTEPRVKAALHLGSDTFHVGFAANTILSDELIAMKEEAMLILKNFITKHNVPNDVPDEGVESSSEEEGPENKPPPKKRK